MRFAAVVVTLFVALVAAVPETMMEERFMRRAECVCFLSISCSLEAMSLTSSSNIRTAMRAVALDHLAAPTAHARLFQHNGRLYGVFWVPSGGLVHMLVEPSLCIYLGTHHLEAQHGG